MRQKIKINIEYIKNVFSTMFYRGVGGSDYHRWSNLSNLSSDWDSRTKQIAFLITPRSSVLEFGAGRMVLRDFLPEGCTYTPSDIVDRGSNTIVCNLNAECLYDFPYHDVAVFSGVLEYVNDVPSLISHISKIARTVIASYAVTDYKSNKNIRLANGWVNDYSLSELENVFLQNGFYCDRVETWNKQKIIVFNLIE